MLMPAVNAQILAFLIDKSFNVQEHDYLQTLTSPMLPLSLRTTTWKSWHKYSMSNEMLIHALEQVMTMETTSMALPMLRLVDRNARQTKAKAP